MPRKRQSIPLGLCQCGCGRKTRLAPITDRSKGYVKGQPLRFVNGHRVREKRHTTGAALDAARIRKARLANLEKGRATFRAKCARRRSLRHAPPVVDLAPPSCEAVAHYRVEKAAKLERDARLIADAKRDFDAYLARLAVERKGGRPRKSKGIAEKCSSTSRRRKSA